MPALSVKNSLAPLTSVAPTSLMVEHRSPQALSPHPTNPRTHKPRQIKLLAKSIQAFGFVVPALVDANDQVIAEHARLEAVIRLGIEQVPVISSPANDRLRH